MQLLNNVRLQTHELRIHPNKTIKSEDRLKEKQKNIYFALLAANENQIKQQQTEIQKIQDQVWQGFRV